ncbi:MAG: alpha/beta hydrolase, partial [Planctomycetaceae bacterium]|nr:alpha/beta hydrolase [Planctomycetaceae bacterium]
HLFQPDPAPTQPAGAVLFFHGGGFATTRLHQFEPQAAAVASAGMVGIVVEYRVSGDGVDRDQSIDDGRAAVAWIRTNADRLGIDPHRIALAGASAGGYLVTNADADPDAYVLFNPAVSAQVAARSDDAPTIVFHSRADTIVAFADAESYCNAEPDCHLVAYDTGDHGFFNNGDAYTDTLNHTIKFLTTHGW